MATELDTNFTAYSPHAWTPGTPINQARMSELETGVKQNRDNTISLNTAVGELAPQVQNIKDGIGTNEVELYNSKTLWQAISTLYNSIEHASGGSLQGEQAWGQIVDLIGRDTLGNLKQTLSEYFSEHFTQYTNEDNNIKAILGTITDSHGVTSYAFNTTDTVYKAVKAINDAIGYGPNGESVFGKENSETHQLVTVLSVMTQLSGNVATVLEALNNAAPNPPYTSLANRLDIMNTAITNATNAIDAAKVSSVYTTTVDSIAVPTTYGSLDERLEHIETVAAANTTNIGTLTGNVNDNYVRKTDVKNDFLSDVTNLPLSAARGKELREMIGGEYSASSTVTGAINAAQTAAETYADNHKVDVTNVYNDIDYDQAGKVLDARQGAALAGMISDLNTSTDTRLDAIEDELDDARIQIGIDENTQEPIMSTLDQRLDSMDTTAAGIRADLTTVIAELGMNDTNGLKTIGTRVDDLAENIATLATELDMQMSAGKITDTQSRIDDLAYDISHTATQKDNTVGLTQRITTLETDLDTAEGNISELDQRLDTIDGGTAFDDTNGSLADHVSAAESAIATKASASDLTTLAGRVTDLENTPKSATVIIDSVTYDSNGIPTNVSNPSTDADYLLKNGDKYYYWKYMKTGSNPDTYAWELISGGGGSGSGSSSGAFAATLESIQEPDLNTDYFVGNGEDGYLHYRFIEQANSDSLVPVLIGVNPDNIKRYNIKRVTGKKREYDNQTQTWTTTDEDVEYLNLYEFDYGVSNDQANIEESMVPVGQVELPQGGGGGSAISTTPRVVRITPSNVTTVQNDNRIYLHFFYAAIDATGESIDGTYTLKYNNASVIDSGSLNSGAYDQTVTTGVWPAAPRPVGFYELDVTDYCRLGTQTFNLTVTTNGQNIPRTWTINILELRLDSNAPTSQLIEVGDTIQFPYTPYGAMTKTLYAEVDGTVVATRNLGASVSGSELEIPIPSQTHGAHSISLYLKANLSGEDVTTDPPITRDYIWYDAEDEEADTLIIASPYRYATLGELTNVNEWVANTSYAVGDKVKVTTGSTVIGYVCKQANSDSTFNANNWTAQVINAEQYGEINIPYTIYNKDSSTTTVNYYSGETLLDTVVVSTNGTLTYAFEEFGTKTLSIVVGTTRLDFNVEVKEILADVAPVANAVITFDPATLTNSSANRLPTWDYNGETYHMTVSDNFNWADDVSGGGYKEDIDGKCFVIKAGTYAEFDYKMFKQSVDTTDPSNPIYSSAAFNKGAEMKITFKVSAVRRADAVWFTNVGNPASNNPMPIGIQLSAHQGWLKTSAADAAEKQAQLEGTTASTNSYLYFPYSEEDKIELDININRTGNREDFIMSYEDGVPSKAYAYETTEILYHEPGNESVIRIGSADCDVYIYKLRIYDKGLTTNDILRNFIADGKTVTEKIGRYNRNSIYYDSTKPEGQQFTPYKTGSAVLDPEKLAEKMPDVKILMLEAPTFTKSKNTFVKSKLRCIHAEGGTAYPSRGDEDNWLLYDGYHSGQGTTSDNYGQSSRNVDFLFMCDGTHTPTKKKNLPTDDYVNYVSKLIKGADKTVFNPSTKTWEPAIDATVYDCIDWKDDDTWKANTAYAVDDIIRANGQVYQCSTAHTSSSTFETTNWTLLPNYTNKVSLTSTSIPNNYFNLKVNVASSENVNNALFQKRYNDYLPYTSPAKLRDARTKNDMEFVPAILFIRETDTTQDENQNYVKHLEFNDTEWHFYSLGNIGDSKKTDYTRAYDPDDMNEFTVEISDNNTSNSQFQSGVYMSNGERVVETEDSAINSMNYIWDLTDEEWNAQRDPTEQELDHDYRVANEIKYYADGVTEVENNKYNYILPNGKVYVNYRHRTLSTEPFDGKHSFEFRYACCGDYRDGDKINDTHGKVNNVSRDDTQFDLNRAVVEAFYEWVVTASNEEFVNELSEWCVPEAVEYFYAFTHFYTMMDNRAKNCFWHFAKTGSYREVHHPKAALYHVYMIKDGNDYVKPSGDFDPNGTYYTEYAFDLWAYDMDTAAGIDNNGELIFPYGKEDGDYRQAGVSSSGYVFNGAGSIIWRRLSTSFTDQIADIFNQVNENYCFDSASLITEFDTFQNCFPEEMWRLDIERKYVRTFTGKVYDNCKLEDDGGNTKQNTRFLKEMMQGRKKYQRRQWVRDQAIYFGSKYMLNNVRNNTIEMVCYTPDAPLWNSRGYEYKENDTTLYRPFVVGDFTFYGTENNRKLYKCIEANSDSVWTPAHWKEGVTPNYKLKLTPYQDMYLNVAVGNGNLRTPQRAVAGQEYTIDCTANMNETRVYIYAGSYIQAISGLAPFYIGANIFSSAARLKKLDLGTDNDTYHNTNLKGLTILANMPILEELNIKNCDNLNTPINLSESNNLKIVEAEGSSIPSLSLPAYTSIETLHLPSTVNILTLQSARKLTDFYMKNKETGLEDYSSLINMNITDSDYSDNVDWIDIALSALEHLNTVYLRGLNKATIQDITDLEPFAVRKKELETQYDDQGNLINKLNISGLIHVLGSWSSIEISDYLAIWPDITFDTIANNEVTRWKITYKYDDYIGDNGETIEGAEIKTLYVRGNTRIPDIVYDNTIDESTIVRNPTTRYEYSFGEHAYGYYVENSGWKAQNTDEHFTEMPLATRNMIIETYFTKTPRRYQVKWYMRRNDPSSLVKTSTGFVEYGGGEGLEAPTIAEIHAAGQDTAIINSLSNGTVRYSIFKGWETLPIEIHPSANDTAYNIYADWETSSDIALGDLFNDTTSLTPEQLFVYAHMSPEERTSYAGLDKIDLSKQITYEMGHDSIEEGQMLIGPGGSLVNGVLRLDMTPTPKVTTIQPMRENNDAFTIMIDYSFNPSNPTRYNNKSAGILMSCYYQNTANNVISGFALYDNLNSSLGSTGPRIGFGAMFNSGNYSVSVGGKSLYHEARNVLVLRHPKGDTKLYVYSGLTSDNKIAADITDVTTANLEWSAATNNAYINFGQLTDSTDTEYNNLKDVMTAANATIYQAKYWSKDLGVGECKRLAAWPHEKVTFGIAKINNSMTSGSPVDNIPTPALGLNTLTTSSYGHLTEETAAMGWGNSSYRTIVNNHVMLGLPTKLQAVLNKPKVKYMPLTIVEDSTGAQSRELATIASSQNDYLFFPSICNLTNSYSQYAQETNSVSFEQTPYPWIRAANVVVYDYHVNGTHGNWDLVTGGDIGRYMNLRFSNKPLKSTIRVFRETANSFSTGTTTNIYAQISTGVSSVEVGDIFIDITGNAYMYISNEDISQLGLQVQPNSGIFICNSGGWIQGSGFWTRSMMVPDMYSSNTANHMIYSNKAGTTVTGYSTNNAVSYAEGLGLNYSITI